MACVYKHIRSDSNEVFYIGIGKNIQRAYSKYNRNKFWKAIVNKCNGNYKIEVIHTDISWEEACEKEKEYILFYGRKNLNKGTLCNMTDGGEGICNLKHTFETKSKISTAAKERFSKTSHVRKGGLFVNSNSRKVVLLNLKTYIIYKFNTLVEASIYLNTTPSRIRRACIVSKSINGYYLKFGTDITKKELNDVKDTFIYELNDKTCININKNYSNIQKKVINSETKEIFNSITDVCKKYGYTISTLSRQLKGVSKNKTVFKLL